jgi:hypothetical protein
MDDSRLEWVTHMASALASDAATGAATDTATDAATGAATNTATDAADDAADDVADDAAPDESAAAVVAGTLCLMSCFSQHPLPLYAQRVAGNLHRLATNPAMTPELRSVCRRLSCQWDGIADDARRSADLGIPPADLRPLH